MIFHTSINNENLMPTRNSKVSSRIEKKHGNASALIFISKSTDFYFYRLDGIGSIIWYLCDGRHTLGSIYEILSKKYKIKLAKIKYYVDKFVNLLFKEELLIEKLKGEPSRLFNQENKDIVFSNEKVFCKPKFKKFRSGCLSPKGFDRDSNPVFVYFEITKKCNLNCKHCYSTTTSEDLPTDEIKRVVDELVRGNVLMVCIMGGEPFARDDFFEILEYIRNKGIRVFIVTNGTLLSEDKLLKLKNLDIDRLCFSLEGATPARHNNIRGKNIFQIVIRNIKLSVSIGVPVEISFTLLRNNFSEYNLIYSLAKKIKVPRIAISHFKRVGSGLKHSSELEYTFFQLFKIHLRSFIFNQRKGEVGICFPKVCDAGHSICNIKPDGTIAPCLFINIPFGNIFENSLEEIWGNSKFKQLIDYSNFKFPCRRCPKRTMCCKAETYYAKGSYFETNPYCTIIKIYDKINGWFRRIIQ